MSEMIPCPFCGEIAKECNDVATATGGAGMRKLSDKAKKLITDFSEAASNLTHQPTQPSYNKYTETRDALENFVRNLEAKVAENKEVTP